MNKAPQNTFDIRRITSPSPESFTDDEHYTCECILIEKFGNVPLK